MNFIRLPIMLVFVMLLTACSDKQKPAEAKQAVMQKELTPQEKFARLYREAEAGNAKAQYDLAEMYSRGEGAAKAENEAFKWWQKAAEQKYAPAQYELGVLYANGSGVPKDVAKAIEWWQKAATQGYAKAQFALGFTLDPSHPGFHASNEISDATKALEWFQKAAAGGNADAQNRLGWKYAFGDGVPQDAAKAAEWWQKAAAQGHVESQFMLGRMYATGEGVPKDDAKALEWFQKAAAQGNVGAQRFLGKMYWTGEGVGKNVILAYAWLNLAAVKDDGGPAATLPTGKAPEASIRELRDAMEARLTLAQRAEGQRLSSSWKKGDILQASSESAPNASASGGAPTKQGTGTGFVVSSSGYALTNYHVIDGCKEVRAAGLDGTIKVVTSDTVNDLALLQMTGKADAATLTDNPAKLRQGEDVIVYGYPLNSVLSSGGNLTPGTVSALSGLGNNTNQIQITAPIQPGSSGSPVLDKKGNVIGVVSAKLSDLKMAKATGSIGQNVNFAINGQTVKAFLDANKVSYKTGGGFLSREKNNADIGEEARKWTVVLECWR